MTTSSNGMNWNGDIVTKMPHFAFIKESPTHDDMTSHHQATTNLYNM